MGVGNTNSLPGRGRPNATPERRAPGFPLRVPGGADGIVAIPSRSVTPLKAGGPRGGLVAGGIPGPRVLFRPSIDKQAPYFVGAQELNTPVMRHGIQWLRGKFWNTAGIRHFQPSMSFNRTSNSYTQGQIPDLASIPRSMKQFNYGGLRRQYNGENALYRILPTFHIQKPARIRQTVAQPQQNAPYQPKLTRQVPAKAYGQTTKTLLPTAIANALSKSQFAPNSASGDSTYGTY